MTLSHSCKSENKDVKKVAKVIAFSKAWTLVLGSTGPCTLWLLFPQPTPRPSILLAFSFLFYLTFPPHSLYLVKAELINITKNYMVGLIVSFARELIESKLCGLRFLISHLGRRSMQWSECRVPQHPSPQYLGRRIQSGPGQSIMWLLEVAHCTLDQQNTITASGIHISEGPRNTASSFEAFVTTAMENACLGLGDRKLLLLFSC